MRRKNQGVEPIRENRVKNYQKWVFVRKKVVQFQNRNISEKTLQGPGSIPEWKS